MWIFTTGGFVSAVEHRDDENYTMVRARDKKSLEEMLSGLRKAFEEAGHTEEKIEETMKSMEPYAVFGDYKWRVVMPKSAFACFLVFETMNYLNYSNFKSKLTNTRGDKWHDAAMKVWSAMHSITDTQKTGNPDVDNPKPYSYYKESGGKSVGTYPAKKVGSVGSEVLDDWSDRESPIDDTNWYGADYHQDTKVGTYWGEHLGIEEFEADDYDRRRDVDDVVIVPDGTNGYHTFSGKDFGIDGRGEIVDGVFLGASFLEDGTGGPTDRELEALELEEAEGWQPWDEETEFNIVTGETRSKVTEKAVGIHAMSDAEFASYENEL